MRHQYLATRHPRRRFTGSSTVLGAALLVALPLAGCDSDLKILDTPVAGAGGMGGSGNGGTAGDGMGGSAGTTMMGGGSGGMGGSDMPNPGLGDGGLTCTVLTGASSAADAGDAGNADAGDAGIADAGPVDPTSACTTAELCLDGCRLQIEFSASCDIPLTEDECLFGCEFTNGYSACEAEVRAFRLCVMAKQEFECVDDPSYSLPVGCDDEQFAMDDCLLSSLPDE